jgi:hypothetical protein
MKRKKSSGLCLIHQVSDGWIEDSMDGQHVVFEKWAWRDIRLGGRDFLLVPERAVFATLEGADEMNRKELLAELNAKVEEIVKDEVPSEAVDYDVTQDEADNIDAMLGGDIARGIVDDDLPDGEGAEEDVEDEKEEGDVEGTEGKD